MKVLPDLIDVWVDRPFLDYPITGAVVVAAVEIAPRGVVNPGQWGGFYQTLASVSGILLSLGTVIITLLFTVTPNERLHKVIRLRGHRLRRLVMSSLTMLVFTTIGFLALFGLNDASGTTRVIITSSLLAMMVLRFLRLWWLVHQVMRVLVTGMSAPDTKPWARPPIQPGDYTTPRREAPRSPVS